MDKKNLRTYEKVNRCMNYVALGWLWFITSLPIVTVGASATATYFVFKKCMDNEEGYIFSQFFEKFKADFKVATKTWMMLLAVILVVSSGACSVVLQKELYGEYRHLFIALFVLEAILVFMICIYVFPYIATFNDNPVTCLKNSFMISIKHIRYSILAVTLNCILVIVGSLAYIAVILLPAILAYINTKIVRKVLMEYIKK